MGGLIGHIIHRDATVWLPEQVGTLYDFIWAANGIFLHAKRDDLEVCFRVGYGDTRGLAPLDEIYRFEAPKVPFVHTMAMLGSAASWARQRLETVFHLKHSPLIPFDGGWLLTEPEQQRSGGACKPYDDGPGSSYEKAILELHSHHTMHAWFSDQDDRDEQGFRLYAVIGKLLDAQPEIRLRVGCYGYFWNIPAEWVLELPETMRDLHAEEDYAEVRD